MSDIDKKFEKSLKDAEATAVDLKTFKWTGKNNPYPLMDKASTTINALTKLVRVFDGNVTRAVKGIRDLMFRNRVLEAKVVLMESLLTQEEQDAVDNLIRLGEKKWKEGDAK